MQKIKADHEDNIAKIEQKLQKATEEKEEENTRHNENFKQIASLEKKKSSLQRRITDLENANGNYDAVLSSLTRHVSVEASKRKIEVVENGSRYKHIRGLHDPKPYEAIAKIRYIMDRILDEFDSSIKNTQHNCDKCLPQGDELMQGGADRSIAAVTMVEQFVAREATERGIHVSGETSTMVHAILNELDLTREELIRCKLSRQKADKSVGAVEETSDKGTVTVDDFPSSVEETQSVAEGALPLPIGDLGPVTLVIEVNEAFRQMVASNPSLAPLKVELEGLRARVPDECEEIRSPAKLPAITMETRPEDDQYLRDLDYYMGLYGTARLPDHHLGNLEYMGLIIPLVACFGFYLAMFIYQVLSR